MDEGEEGLLDGHVILRKDAHKILRILFRGTALYSWQE